MPLAPKTAEVPITDEWELDTTITYTPTPIVQACDTNDGVQAELRLLLHIELTSVAGAGGRANTRPRRPHGRRDTRDSTDLPTTWGRARPARRCYAHGCPPR